MSREIRAELLSLLFFLMHGWRFLEQIGHEATICDDGIGSGGTAFVWSQGVQEPQRYSKYQFLASRKIVCRLNQKFEAPI
jgi:hypothetical protein